MLFRSTTLDRVLYSLGINVIGRTASKLITGKYTTPDELVLANKAGLLELDGIGDVLANAFVEYWQNPANVDSFKDLLKELTLEEAATVDTASAISGKTFVITGSTNIWGSRNDLKAFIESKGGKVGSAVSKNTDYLVNNDSTSGSSKNKKAKELGVQIITEVEFKTLVE